MTNVATLLERYPERARSLRRIVMVGGRRPGQLFHPGEHWWFHFGDFNVAQDVEAVRVVLHSGVPVTLVPFELAIQMTITASELEWLRGGDDLARRLAEASDDWLSFWRGGLMEREGFSPFDALAVGYAPRPDLFTCSRTRARVGFSVFLAPFGLGRDLEVAGDIEGAPVTYCRDLDPSFESLLLERLRGRRGSSRGAGVAPLTALLFSVLADRR